MSSMKAMLVGETGTRNRRGFFGSVLVRLDQHLVPLETRSTSTASPAKAGVHRSAARKAEKWVPAFALWSVSRSEARMASMPDKLGHHAFSDRLDLVF